MAKGRDYNRKRAALPRTLLLRTARARFSIATSVCAVVACRLGPEGIAELNYVVTSPREIPGRRQRGGVPSLTRTAFDGY